MSYYREQLEAFLSSLDVRAERLLDIGGKQKPVRGRTRTWNVNNYEILDLPEFDLEKPIRHTPGDMIFCLEVFEYLINPLAAMQNIADLLRPGGTAYVSFAFVYPLHNEVELDSLRYTLSGIHRLAKAVNLKITNIHYRRTKTNSLYKYYQEDGMKMAKGHDHNVTGYIVEFRK